MAVRAIFTQSGVPFWIDVAAYLRDNFGWEIPFFIGGGFCKKKVSEEFPGSIFCTNNEAKENRMPGESFGIKFPPLDEQLLSELSPYETVLLKMLDRYNIDGSFTLQKRFLYYHSQVMYWKGILNHFKPDIVVFRKTPHLGFDYILYSLCRISAIDTIMFERTSLPGLIFPEVSFEEGSALLHEAYTGKVRDGNIANITISDKSQEHIDNLTNAYSRAIPFHLKYKLKQHKGGTVGNPITILFLTAKDILRGFFVRSSDPRYLKTRFFKNMGRFKKRKLIAHYNRLAKEVDLEKPYIFVALQCEPERQTSPSGGVFGNQYLMVDLLSKIVPEGWKIYVKEHVSQFKSYQVAERARDTWFYDYIDSMRNVELVPLSHTSFDLIDKCKASATVSGTVGWESILRGKPAFLFGYSWYRDCEGVFTVRTAEDAEKALRHIEDGYVVDKKKVMLYVSAVEEVSMKGYIDDIYEAMNTLTPEENVRNLAVSINDFYHKRA